VTGDVGDRREILGEAGILVTPGSSDALAEGVMRVLGNEMDRLRMAESARSRCERYYWDRLVHDFARVYDL
jgi:glycosyltransferase involved in cell wall biosynthesis